MTSPSTDPQRWAWAEIDLPAIALNIGVLHEAVAPSAVWAVVKADGYGHGAIEVARTAVAAGVGGLCVALASEGATIRAAGIDSHVPILVLSEQPSEWAAVIVEHGLTATVTSPDGVDALADAAVIAGRTDVPVHIKIDTGMHRVGASPDDAAAVWERIASRDDRLRLDGVFTHLAVADEPDDPYTASQLATFDDARSGFGGHPLVHTANSAGALAHPASRRALVRAGIAIYGISPGPGVDELAIRLRPALALKARVSFVKRLPAGARLSYGLHHRLDRDATVATVPVGYADGVRRSLSGRHAEVLVGGHRREIVGSITMDQLLVDCGDDRVAVGDEVVLLGRQGSETIRVEEWAGRLGTIGYEIVCGISPRVPRHYIRPKV